MADVTATKARLRRYVSELARRGFDEELALLDQGVPRGSGPSNGPRLSETRQTARTDSGGTITYNSPKANWTNDGVAAHPIFARAGSSLMFVWPGGPPALASPRGSATFHFKSVMWKPGFGVANNIGWWDKRVNEETWHNVLVAAQSQVEF